MTKTSCPGGRGPKASQIMNRRRANPRRRPPWRNRPTFDSQADPEPRHGHQQRPGPGAAMSNSEFRSRAGRAHPDDGPEVREQGRRAGISTADSPTRRSVAREVVAELVVRGSRGGEREGKPFASFRGSVNGLKSKNAPEPDTTVDSTVSTNRMMFQRGRDGASTSTKGKARTHVRPSLACRKGV